jgi:hypothetical protein
VAAPSGPAARIAVTGFVDARLANQRYRDRLPRQSATKVGLGLPPHPELSALFAEPETSTNASWTVSAGDSPAFAR